VEWIRSSPAIPAILLILLILSKISADNGGDYGYRATPGDALFPHEVWALFCPVSPRLGRDSFVTPENGREIL
jgi:hypothetical protein